MATWGAYQSLAQLSATTNGAFSALIDTVNANIIIERAKLLSLLKEIKALADDGIGARDAATGVSYSVDCRSILGTCDDIERFASRAMIFVVRPLCIIGSITGFVFLTIASEANGDAPPYAKVLIICSNLPFFIGIVGVALNTLRIFLKVTLARLSLETKVLRAE